MFSVIPVSLVAMPLAVARFLAMSRTVRVTAVLAMVIRESTRGYQPGEGPLSLKMPVAVAPGKGMGGILHDLASEHKELESFKGSTFRVTTTEAKSLGLLVEAAVASPTAVPALVDWLEKFPRRR
jgi:hypothetical protein